MAENATVARPYAEALFRVAQAGKESFSLAAWSELVAELAQIGAHPEVQAFARNPKASASDVSAAITALLKSPMRNSTLASSVPPAPSARARAGAAAALGAPPERALREWRQWAHAVLRAFERADAAWLQVRATLQAPRTRTPPGPDGLDAIWKKVTG